MQALESYAPGRRFVFSSLKPFRARDARWVLRAKERGHPNSFVCKTSARTEGATIRLKRQYQRQAEMASLMPSPKYRVPDTLAFDTSCNTFIMEDAKGSSVADWIKNPSDTSNAPRLFRKSGRWLSKFHAPNLKVCDFNPTPQVNWLRKTVREELPSGKGDLEAKRLLDLFCQLEAQCEKVRGKATLRTITHRDFHTGNLVMKRNGALYGIDFENHNEDEAFRDVFSFLLDAMARIRPNSQTLSEFNNILTPFSAAYTTLPIDPSVMLFIQRAFSLNELRNIHRRKDLSPLKAAKKHILWMIANSEAPLI